MSEKKSELTVEDLVKTYEMIPHREGGYFLETYRSTGVIPRNVGTTGLKEDRCFSTAIYYLLPAGAKSRLHRIASDEIWHFYLGGPMTLVQLFPDGKLEKVILGPDIRAGQKLQHVVPAGCWFGGYPNPEVQYSFVGCTVAPGFDFRDFEVGKKDELMPIYPELKNLLEDLAF